MKLQDAVNEVNRIGRDRCGSYLTASYGVTRSNKTYREPVLFLPRSGR
jgi:hypothetical protein